MKPSWDHFLDENLWMYTQPHVQSWDLAKKAAINDISGKRKNTPCITSKGLKASFSVD